jgi:putative hydrolase of the HAD superfamily
MVVLTLINPNRLTAEGPTLRIKPVGARERERAAYGFEELVDDIVYSHEVGMAKPDPRIYLLACSRLDVTPGDVVFVDDSEVAVAGAESVGMTTIRHVNNTATISALDALL